MAALLRCADPPRSPLRSRLALGPKSSARVVRHPANVVRPVVVLWSLLCSLPPRANPHEQVELEPALVDPDDVARLQLEVGGAAVDDVVEVGHDVLRAVADDLDAVALGELLEAARL